jgi:hypothetical protein
MTLVKRKLMLSANDGSKNYEQKTLRRPVS